MTIDHLHSFGFPHNYFQNSHTLHPYMLVLHMRLNLGLSLIFTDWASVDFVLNELDDELNKPNIF